MDKSMFLLVPGPPQQRVLAPGKVFLANGREFGVMFDQQAAVEVGTSVLIFAEVGGKFFQHGATVTALLQIEPTAIEIQLVGEPSSAEQRQTFRVSVAAIGIAARIAKEQDCRVVDLSPEGFGAIAEQQYALGSSVQASFEHEGHLISVLARVQTIKTRADGSFRYGFLAPDKQSPARKSLQVISKLVERQQLQRRLSDLAA